eukprot:749399-Hanusia_phi.AAC.1
MRSQAVVGSNCCLGRELEAVRGRLEAAVVRVHHLPHARQAQWLAAQARSTSGLQFRPPSVYVRKGPWIMYSR